ncbi:MAG: NUDIX hydrolase [Parcubacteria group bacterium Gr01-1014_33]|nr:MAG: NUDIX hydrolase [Parcubacteria group bacterium Gr01-1014_33]
MPHIHDKIDFTAEVFVVYQDKVLLRKHDKYKMWLGVGGHIELDEDPNQAAVREVKEEVGLDVVIADDRRQFQREEKDYRELIPPQFLNRHRVSDTHEHITLTYFARANTDKVILPNNHEKSDEIKWFTREELEKNEYGIAEAICYYALRALEETRVKV